MIDTPPADLGTPIPAPAALPKEKDIRRWHFKRRGWPLVFFNLFWIVCYPHVSHDEALTWGLGAGFILAALGIRLRAVSHLGWRSARTHREKARTLVMTGPYGLARSPLYVASSFAVLKAWTETHGLGLSQGRRHLPPAGRPATFMFSSSFSGYLTKAFRNRAARDSHGMMSF